MEKILCYGDSNTYGFNPKNQERYSEDIRWSGRLKKLLIKDYEVIECGCTNRTGFFDNDMFETTGSKHLPCYLEENKNTKFDIVILGLGANDLQIYFDHTEENIKNGLKNLTNIIRNNNNATRIILLAPPEMNEHLLTGYCGYQFNQKSIEQSHDFTRIYKQVSKEINCEVITLNELIKVSDYDGIHYSEDSHRIIAEYIANYIKG